MLDTSWFIAPQPQQKAQWRLFAFPYAGGGVPVYRGWAQALAPQIELQVLQMPGRGSRLSEAPFTRLENLLDAVFPDFQALSDLPCVFFGYSLGGLIAFELARRWRAESGGSPAHFFAAACQAPQVFQLRRKRERGPIHALPEADFLDYLRGMDFAPAETLIQHSALREVFLPTVRADLEMGETYLYRPAAPLETPITVFGGRNDSLVTETELGAWREQTSRSFQCVMLDRKHDFLESDRKFLVGEVLRALGLGDQQ